MQKNFPLSRQRIIEFRPENKIKEIVNKVDTNKNGELEFPEFCGARSAPLR